MLGKAKVLALHAGDAYSACMSLLSQVAYPSDGAITIRVELPPAEAHVLPGHPWGDAGGLFTPAYWAANSRLFAATSDAKPHRLGGSLAEEMAACLLGGYGMPAELGLAAFARLRGDGLLYAGVSAAKLEGALSHPFRVNGRIIHYRFPRQKARYLADCLVAIDRKDLVAATGRYLRDALQEFPGIGPKTASWIARNWLDADDVAILDVHIVHAMKLLSLIESVVLPRDYGTVEAIFLRFANAVGVRPSILDAVMWQHMRRWGYLASTRLAG